MSSVGLSSWLWIEHSNLNSGYGDSISEISGEGSILLILSWSKGLEFVPLFVSSIVFCSSPIGVISYEPCSWMCLRSAGNFFELVSTTTCWISFWTYVWLRGTGTISVGLSKFSRLLIFFWFSIFSAILSTRITEPDSIMFFYFLIRRPFLDQMVPIRVCCSSGSLFLEGLTLVDSCLMLCDSCWFLVVCGIWATELFSPGNFLRPCHYLADLWEFSTKDSIFYSLMLIYATLYYRVP